MIRILITLLLLFPALAFAQKKKVAPKPAIGSLQGIELKADEISRDYEKRTVILEGHVVIGMGTEKISCDKAVINLRKQEVIAEGHVTLESEMAYVEGKKILYNYGTKLGEIQEGLVQSGQVVFIGELIKKNSETNYLAKSAKYTSCATCPPGWSISGTEIEAEIGGYAYIKYPVLRIADFPVFILPRMLVPLKTARQTGFLVPSASYSDSGGTAIALPYFWAISPSQDMTYTLKNYQRRGLKQLVEYRYVAAPGSVGRLDGAYLKDHAFTEDGKGKEKDTTTLERGFTTYKHHFNLPNNFVQRAEVNYLTDLRYPRDFSKEMEGHGAPALENKASVTHNSNGDHFSLEATHYTNLLQENALADNDDAVHRLPEINYQFMTEEIFDSNLYFKMDFNYVNFARSSYSYDDLNTNVIGQEHHAAARDGKYDPKKDLLRTGQRYIFQPSISFPFHIGRLFDVNPSIMYNETQYRFNAEPDPLADSKNYTRDTEQRYVQADISIKTKFSGIYGGDGPLSTRYKHEIVPEIIYSNIPWIERSKHVFFGDFDKQSFSRSYESISNADLDGTSKLQFDYNDRLFDKDITSIVISNYLIEKTPSTNQPIRKIATLRLGQSYDFNNARQADDPSTGKRRAFPWSTIAGLLDVRLRSFETHTVADYYPYAQLTNWSTRMRFISQMRNYLELTYTRNVILKEPDNPDISSRTETYGGGVGMRTKYFDLGGGVNLNAITNALESWEYNAAVKLPGDCWNIEFGQKKTLGSDTDYNISLNFQYGGQ